MLESPSPSSWAQFRSNLRYRLYFGNLFFNHFSAAFNFLFQGTQAGPNTRSALVGSKLN